MTPTPTNWDTFWQIAPTLISLTVLLISIAGFIYASGKVRERVSNMLTKEEFLKHCKVNQDDCAKGVGVKIDELKKLVIELHDKQSTKIEQMDEKREKAKTDTSDSISQSSKETARELSQFNSRLGKIEGHIEAMRNGNYSHSRHSDDRESRTG